MDDRVLMIVLRLFHILGGVFWAGAMLVSAGFLYPAAREGAEGGRTLQRIMVNLRLARSLWIAAGLTILSGLLMYGRLASITGGAWTRSRPGIAFGVGGLLAIVAAIVAGAVIVPGGRRLGELGARLPRSGPPSPDDAAEMKRLQQRMFGTTRIIALLLVLTVAAMAVAQYL